MATVTDQPLIDLIEQEEARKRTQVLYFLLITGLTMTLASIGALWILPQKATGAWIIAALIAYHVLGLHLLRIGYIQVVSWSFPSLLWVFYTAMAYSTGGVQGIGTVNYFIIILIAGLTLGGRAALGFTGLSIATSIGLVFLETNGLLPPSTLPVTSWISLIPQISNFIWAAVALYITSNSLIKSFQFINRGTSGAGVSHASLEAQLMDRERAMEALKSSQERLEILFEYAPDAIYLSDLKGTFVDGNQAAEDLVGYPREALIGRSFLKLNLLPANQIPKAAASLARNAIGKRTGPDEFTLNRADGAEVETEISTYPVRLDGQQLVLGIARDVTERNATAREHKSRRNYLEALLNSAPDAIVTLDKKNVIVEWNKGAEHLFGYQAEEAEGKNIDVLIANSETAAEATQLTQRVLEGEELLPFETTRYRKDGSPVEVVVSGSPIFFGDQLLGAVAVYTDITERVEAERALQRAHDDLEVNVALRTLALKEANSQLEVEIKERQRLQEDLEKYAAELKSNNQALELRNDELVALQGQLETFTGELQTSNQELQHFAYVASHDLQEPLRMISSYLQLLQRRYAGQIDGEADEFIHYAVDGARRMQELINGLLTYSRVETKTTALAPTDCNQILDQVKSNLKVAIEENDAVINTNGLPTILGDNNQLIQLFQNLVANAIKYRQDTPPVVNIFAEKRNGLWTFCVKDNGQGFDSTQAERIFMIFQRLHTQDEIPGLGLGLAISKKIVERHGGRIWAQGMPGSGAEFHFTLPAGDLTE